MSRAGASPMTPKLQEIMQELSTSPPQSKAPGNTTPAQTTNYLPNDQRRFFPRGQGTLNHRGRPQA
jgi:hypothetical protein